MKVVSNNIIIPGKSLSTFFYNGLSRVNKKVICPLPEEFLFYTSKVLEKYALSAEFYDNVEGRLQNKIYGMQFLENMAKDRQSLEDYKDIGDSIIIRLGVFPESLKKTTVHKDYYLELGRSAYSNLERLDCKFYDIPYFYRQFATSLENVVRLVDIMSKSLEYDNLDKYILEQTEANEAALFQSASSAKAS